MAIGNKEGKVFLYRFNHFYHWGVCSYIEKRGGRNGWGSWCGGVFGVMRMRYIVEKGKYFHSSSNGIKQD